MQVTRKHIGTCKPTMLPIEMLHFEALRHPAATECRAR